MITEKQKQNIIGIIFRMEHMEVQWFKDYTPEEREYIMHLIINQKNHKGFCITTNGTSEDMSTITTFKKEVFQKYFNPKDHIIK